MTNRHGMSRSRAARPPYHPFSSRSSVERLADGADADQLAAAPATLPIGGIDVGLGHDAAAESHLRRFADAKRRLRDAADLAGQPDLAEHRRRRRE